MTIKQHKVVAALPGTLAADSVYYVRVGAGFDIYVTNSAGTLVAYDHNAKLAITGLASRVTALEEKPTYTPAYFASGIRVKLPHTEEGFLSVVRADGTILTLGVTTDA